MGFYFQKFSLCVFFIFYVICLCNGRPHPIAKRSLNLGAIKDKVVNYVRAIPNRWRDKIPDFMYDYAIKKANELADKMEHMFEGDIKGIDKGGGNHVAVLANNAVADRSFLWQQGIVPYEISSSFAPHEVEVIQGALNDMMDKTCIKFVPFTNQKDYLSFVRRSMGCSSYVARVGGKQLVDLQPGCIYEYGEVQHEVMHALGFYHEQSREDRDQYVTIVWDNVKTDQRDQFKKYVSNTLGLKYDYDSIMHYGWNYFAVDITKPTILPAVKAAIGNRQKMSDGDVEKINRLYQCPAKGAVNIPLSWQALPAQTPTPPTSVNGQGTTKCLINLLNSNGHTTEAPSGIGWLFSKFKNVVRDKTQNALCQYISK